MIICHRRPLRNANPISKMIGQDRILYMNEHHFHPFYPYLSVVINYTYITGLFFAVPPFPPTDHVYHQRKAIIKWLTWLTTNKGVFYVSLLNVGVWNPREFMPFVFSIFMSEHYYVVIICHMYLYLMNWYDVHELYISYLLVIYMP